MSERRDEGLKICCVCSSPCESRNFGVISCRACAAFFRRWLEEKNPVKCRRGNHCEVLDSVKHCRGCRLRKCLTVGMRDHDAIEKMEQQPGPSHESAVTRSMAARSTQLQHVHDTYLRLKEWRRNLYVATPNRDSQESPKSISYYQSLIHQSREMPLLSTFAVEAFKNYSELPSDQKSVMFKHFWQIFHCFEDAYNTWMAGETEAVVQSNGDLLYAGREETYRCDSEGRLKISSQAVHEMAVPIHNDFFEKLVARIDELAPSLLEFLTVAILIFWSSGLDDLSEESEVIGQKARKEAIEDYILYCETKTKHPNSAKRLSQLILLIPLVENIVGRFQATVQYMTVLSMYTLERDTAIICLNTF